VEIVGKYEGRSVPWRGAGGGRVWGGRNVKGEGSSESAIFHKGGGAPRSCIPGVRKRDRSGAEKGQLKMDGHVREKGLKGNPFLVDDQGRKGRAKGTSPSTKKVNQQPREGNFLSEGESNGGGERIVSFTPCSLSL